MTQRYSFQLSQQCVDRVRVPDEIGAIVGLLRRVAFRLFLMCVAQPLAGFWSPVGGFSLDPDRDPYGVILTRRNLSHWLRNDDRLHFFAYTEATLMYSEKPNFAVSRAIAPNTSSSRNSVKRTIDLAVVLGTMGTCGSKPIVFAVSCSSFG